MRLRDALVSPPAPAPATAAATASTATASTATAATAGGLGLPGDVAATVMALRAEEGAGAAAGGGGGVESEPRLSLGSARCGTWRGRGTHVCCLPRHARVLRLLASAKAAYASTSVWYDMPPQFGLVSTTPPPHTQAGLPSTISLTSHECNAPRACCTSVPSFTS